ncbi:hypothetical protein ACHQM5_001850 [Ranunculus cassubicifolius]
MHTIKEKLSNMSSSTKQHVKSSNANIEEKELVHEKKKAKDAQAKMELHQAKADHKADKLNARHARVMHGHTPAAKTTHP